MDLDKLFTVTDYETRVITIPCHDDDDDERPDHGGEDLIDDGGGSNKACEDEAENHKALAATATQHHPRSIEIEIVCSPSASTDYDLTGQILWPVSILLAHYLALASSSSSSSSSSSFSTTTSGRRKQLLLQSRNVVELGAGTGLPGLVAAACGARHVTLTDGNEIVCDTILNKNIAKFQQKQHGQQQREQEQVVSCQPLVWGNRKHLNQLLKHISNNRVDVVLAADVVQWPAVVEPLLHTVKALLWNAHIMDHDQTQEQGHHQPPIFLLGIVNRATATYNLFFQLARELGFEYKSIRPEEYLLPNQGGQPATLPDSCREYGGRETEIYELTLQRRASSSNDSESEGQLDLEPPVLLQPRRRQGNGKDDDDCDDEYSETVGKSFQNTAFLPC